MGKTAAACLLCAALLAASLSSAPARGESDLGTPAPPPTATAPVETRPAETWPAETAPVETKPAETKPVETKPAETKPAETKPVETAPVETKPVPNAQPPAAITLTEDLVVGPGESVSYITGGAAMPELALELGYLPYGLTFDADGHQIVVQDGGSLTIRTLNHGGGDPRPVIRGTLSPQGLFRVEPGGHLVISDANLELEGEGLFVWQEDGGLFENPDGLVPDQVRYGAPVVCLLNQPFSDLYLEEGTALSPALLPASAPVSILEDGALRSAELAVAWDIERTDTGAKATGTFLDESGVPVPSAIAAVLTVHWYAPEEILLTSSQWLGDSAGAARLSFTPLPEEAERVWGQVSEDGGETWSDGECRVEADHIVFYVAGSRPRSFRVAAESADRARRWASEAVLLPQPEDGQDDQSGDRGGGDSPLVPDRAPVPAPQPTATPGSTPAPPSTPPPEPTARPAETTEPSFSPEPVPVPSSTPEPGPKDPSEPSATPGHAPAAPPTAPGLPAAAISTQAPDIPTPTPGPTPTHGPVPTPEPTAAPPAETPPAPPAPQPLVPTAQYILGGLALLACAAVGVWAGRGRR